METYKEVCYCQVHRGSLRLTQPSPGCCKLLVGGCLLLVCSLSLPASVS